jgi:LPS export ABC transporter protein LptC
MRGREVESVVRRGVCAALALAASACGPALEGLEPVRPGRATLPPAELEGVVFEGYRGELRDLFVTSERATVDMVGRVAQLSGVRLALAEPTRGPIEVSAPSGEFKLDEDDFLLSGGVEGTAAKGERFSTQRLEYVAKRRELVSREPVTLSRESFVLRADGLALDLVTRRVRLVGQVQARVKPR